MATEKTKRQWLNECKKAIEHLITSQEETVLDARLFNPKELGCLFGRLPVATMDVDCEYFTRLRANRLKYLGYKWDSGMKQWLFMEGNKSE